MKKTARSSLRRLLFVGAAVLGLTVCFYAAPAVSAPARPHTSPHSSLAKFDTVNGDILALRSVRTQGQHALVLAGSFSMINTANGHHRKAANLAIVNERSGKLLWAAHSTSANGYVRALASSNNVLYVGGDFTAVNGKARSRVLAISLKTLRITAWAPSFDSNVRALAASRSRVFVAGTAPAVTAVTTSSVASVVWNAPVGGGIVRALLRDSSDHDIYVAGYFKSVGGFDNHGLVELDGATGTPITEFKPYFTPDGQPGRSPDFNGENPFSLSLDTTTTPSQLLVGSGGTRNFVRMLNSVTGAFIWSHHTVGDAQAVQVMGTNALVGYHRWRRNTGLAWPYYAAELYSTGHLASWQPGISGPAKETDDGGTGVQAFAYDSSAGRLFVGGGFTTADASCDLSVSTRCTGGHALTGLAEYRVTGS